MCLSGRDFRATSLTYFFGVACPDGLQTSLSGFLVHLSRLDGLQTKVQMRLLGKINFFERPDCLAWRMKLGS
jgi:hypothetical protein